MRIDLGDLAYAFVWRKMKHKTNRLIGQATAKFLKVRGGMQTLSVSEGKDGAIEAKPKDAKEGEAKPLAEIDVDLDHADFSEANDVMILNQVQSWSFGMDKDNPKGIIDQQHLDDMDEDKYTTLLKEVNKLYGKLPLALAGSTGSDSSKASP